jgi:hypothetical protein
LSFALAGSSSAGCTAEASAAEAPGAGEAVAADGVASTPLDVDCPGSGVAFEQAASARVASREAEARGRKAFMAASHTIGLADRATSATVLARQVAPKASRLAVEMIAFRMMMASDELTTARVVAQPTPSLPPNVDSPQYPLTTGMAAP